MIYRRFGYIHARLLMQRQDELRELEDDLEDLDKRDGKNKDRQICLQSREMDDPPSGPEEQGRETRSSLLNKIEEKTLKYGTSLTNFMRLLDWNPH